MVDCGGFGTNTIKSQILKVEYLLKGMHLLDYDAINLTERDLQYGTEFLTEMKKKYDLPFVSANVYYNGTKKYFAEPYLILKKAGVKVGIFGVTRLKGSQRLVTEQTGFEIKDPYVAAQSTVEKLRDKCDVVIALSYLGMGGSQELAKNVGGIDFVISGQGFNLSRQPTQIGNAVIMQAGNKGKYLGQFDFNVSSGQISLGEGKVVALDDQIPDDEELANLVKEYDQALTIAFPMDSPKAKADFSQMSERSCMMCHRQQHNQWRTTSHAHAWETLVEEKKHSSADCQKCHTTLFKEPGGFTSVQDTPDLVNVQCVSCHVAVGDVKMHVDRFNFKSHSAANNQANGHTGEDFKPVTEKVCLPCHDQKNSPNFNYAEFLAKVTH